MQPRALAAISTVLTLMALSAAEQAMACSCAGGVSMEKRFEWSDGAIIGRLIKVEPLDKYTALHTYRVLRVYKARDRIKRWDELTMKTPRSGAACGLPSRERREYGMFLEKNAPRWSSSLCSIVSPKKMQRAGEERIGRAKTGCGSPASA